MTVIRGQVIELKPNNKQATYFKKACGVARFAYNWALAEWQRQYQEDKAYRESCEQSNLTIDGSQLNLPSHGKINKLFNAIKREQFPFVMEVTKCAPQIAIQQLGDAYKRFFKGESKYPQFRKKGEKDRFGLSNDKFKIKTENGKTFIQIPKLGWVRMKKGLRFQRKILSATISTRGEKWFVSLNVELSEEINPLPKTKQSVGLDLGITHLATLSDGTKIQAPKPLKNYLKKLRRLNKSLSRKQKGSNNRAKAKAKLSRLYYRIHNIRKDFLHKLTTELVRKFDVICLEHLNVQGMLRNRKLSLAIQDLGFYELKQQLIYKANQFGKTVKSVERFFPSSKACSCCGFKLEKLSLSVRKWTCEKCGAKHDRDINASINILNFANKILTIN
jgi:transposase, IS605 orfB family